MIDLNEMNVVVSIVILNAEQSFLESIDSRSNEPGWRLTWAFDGNISSRERFGGRNFYFQTLESLFMTRSMNGVALERDIRTLEEEIETKITYKARTFTRTFAAKRVEPSRGILDEESMK